MDHAELMLTAELAAIRLKDGELERLGVEVDRMLEYFDVMDSVDVSSFEPTTHASGQCVPLRPDVPSEGDSDLTSGGRDAASIESMLDQAGDLEGRLIVIPNVL